MEELGRGLQAELEQEARGWGRWMLVAVRYEEVEGCDGIEELIVTGSPVHGRVAAQGVGVEVPGQGGVEVPGQGGVEVPGHLVWGLPREIHM